MVHSLTKHIPEAIQEAPKSELVQMVMRARGLAKGYKLREKAAHTGKSLLCTLTGAAGGATAGIVAAFPGAAHIPRTRVRSDLVIGGLIAAAAAFDVFDHASRYVGEYGNGMIDFAIGDVTRTAVQAWRVRTGHDVSAAAAPRSVQAAGKTRAA